MNEPRREAPDVWAVGWWPVRDSSESVLWRPVDRRGWTYRVEGEAWQPVEQMPDHRAVDADVFRLIRLTRPCAEKHMRHILRPGQSGLGGGGIGKGCIFCAIDTSMRRCFHTARAVRMSRDTQA